MEKEASPVTENEKGAATDQDLKFKIFNAVVDRISSLIEKFGLPVAILVVAVYIFLVIFTSGQQEIFIDMYVLGRNLENNYPHILLALAGSAIILLQRWRYRKLIKKHKEEINRLSAWKSGYEEKAIGEKLPSSKPSPNKED